MSSEGSARRTWQLSGACGAMLCVVYLLAVIPFLYIFASCKEAALQQQNASAVLPPSTPNHLEVGSLKARDAVTIPPFYQRMKEESRDRARFMLKSRVTRDLGTLGNRQPSDPFISGDTLRLMSDWWYDETTVGAGQPFDAEQVRAGDVVFLKTDYVPRFFNETHPKIKRTYILITHNSDYGAPDSDYNPPGGYGNYRQYLDQPTLAAWFTQNCACEPSHPKLHPVPIGLENKHWKSEVRGMQCTAFAESFCVRTNRSYVLTLDLANLSLDTCALLLGMIWAIRSAAHLVP